MVVVVLFKQKTAYEVRISDWSSDVCSSDLLDMMDELVAANQKNAVLDGRKLFERPVDMRHEALAQGGRLAQYPVQQCFEPRSVSIVEFFIVADNIGRASCRDRVCQYV